jgi:GAF domain-containing protein
MRIGDQILGVVNVETTRPDAYTQTDQRVLETVAAQMAVALENARLYAHVQRHAQELEERVAERTAELQVANERLKSEATERQRTEAGIQRRLQEMPLLYQVSAFIASAADITDALNNVCAKLARFLEAPQAGFAILNSERTAAEVIADYHPPDSPSAMGAVIPVADNPSMAYILKHKAPLVVSQAQADPLLSPVHSIMRQRNVQSILIVPVIAGGEVIGTLGFDSFEQRVFGDADVDLVQHVANQTGQVLMRRRAEEEVQRRARETAALYETSLEINSQPDLPALLQAIVHRAVELVGVRAGGLYLMQGSGDA